MKFLKTFGCVYTFCFWIAEVPMHSFECLQLLIILSGQELYFWPGHYVEVDGLL